MSKAESTFKAAHPLAREVLPKNVTPTKYDVTLDPNFETFKFDGTVKIDLIVNEDTNSVTLNSHEIEIHSAKINSTNAKAIDIDKSRQTVRFQFEEVFESDSSITLEIAFTGILNDKLAGFYRSSYKEGNETKYLAITQMQPTDCRRAFPSFDEPALKAVFDVTLISDAKLTALSNMDVKEVKELANGKKATIFNSTPVMSTYLVALAVGDFRYVENNTFRVPVRSYTIPGLENQAQFAADLTVDTLSFFEKTFGIEYPLPKVDNLSVPDFNGAMENWGLVIYSMSYMLIDEQSVDLSAKQTAAITVQHELAHQWFGNLVTMDWWDGLWLNEGFATWMSLYSCNKLYPDWKIWQEYVGDTLQQALTADALRDSHPVEVPVEKAGQVYQLFDSISYHKGSSLIRMVTKWLGEDTFFKGVSNYLKKHAYGDTQTCNLWEALSEASGKDVVELMDVWTKKIGFPVITVSEDSETNRILIKQNRYLTTGDVKPEEDETIFPVFLGLKTSKGIDDSIIFNTREEVLTLDDLDFYKLNTDQVGIYRTSYTPERWIKLAKSGTEGLLSVEDRAGLVADAGALSQSGHQSTSTLLTLVNSWKNEPSFFVWKEIIARINAIKAAWIFEDGETLRALDTFTKSLAGTKARELGWEFKKTDSVLEQRLKSILFDSAATAKEEVIEKAALLFFAKYVAGDKKAIHPNLRASVFNTAARLGGEEQYEQIFKIYTDTVSVDEKNTALKALGIFQDPALITRTISHLLDGSIRTQDIRIVLQGLRTHKAGIEASWKWVNENWNEINEKLPQSFSMLGAVVSISISGFSSAAKAEEIETFFAEKDTKGYDNMLAKALDSIKSRASWVERDDGDLNRWLAEEGFKK